MLYQCFDVFFTRFLGRIFLGHQTGETMAASLGWLLMDKIRGSPVEEKVVYLPSFTGFQKHPRWLFEISQPSNSSFILFLLPSQTIWSRHVFPGSSTMYLETKLQLPDIVTTGRFVPNKQGTGFAASYVSLPEGTTLGFHVVSSNIRHRHRPWLETRWNFRSNFLSFPYWTTGSDGNRCSGGLVVSANRKGWITREVEHTTRK